VEELVAMAKTPGDTVTLVLPHACLQGGYVNLRVSTVWYSNLNTMRLIMKAAAAGVRIDFR
jgi:hypothetical protein